MGPQEPGEVIKYFDRYYHEGDLAGLMSLFETDAVLRTRRSVATGRSQIRELLGAIVASGAELTFGESVVLQSGDVALTHTDWAMREADGTVVEGKTVEVLRRQTDGTWKYVIDNPDGVGFLLGT